MTVDGSRVCGSRYRRRMTYETVRYESQDGIVTVTLDRPDHLNA